MERARDIWARSRARGSFHTFLQSLFLLSSWKELIFMSVLERTLVSRERRYVATYGIVFRKKCCARLIVELETKFIR